MGATLYEPVPDDYEDELKPDLPNWVTAIVMLLAVCLLVAAFIWTFIELEPWLTDFVPSDGAGSPPAATMEPEQ